MSEPVGKVLKVLGNPFILGLLTIFGYIAAYFYQMGYLHYFGIPAKFIEITISSIILALSATMILYAIFFYSIYCILTSKKNTREVMIIFAILLSIPTLFYFWPYRTWVDIVKNIFVFFLISFNIYFLFLLIRPIFVKSWIRDLILKNHALLFYSLLFGISHMIFLFYMKGSIDAQYQKNYLILNVAHEKLALISNYRDKGIFLQVDVVQKKLNNKLYFYNFDDNDFQKQPLKIMSIGPLLHK